MKKELHCQGEVPDATIGGRCASGKKHGAQTAAIQGEDDMAVREFLVRYFRNNVLSDGMVQSDIRQIVSGKVPEIESKPRQTDGDLLQLKAEVAEWKTRALRQEKENARCGEEVKRLVQELDEGRSAWKTEKNVLERKLKAVSGFSTAVQAYEMYKGLSAVLRERLKSTIAGDDVIQFIASGVQYEGIERLWQWCYDELVQGNREAKELVKIFDYFFALGQSTGTLPQLERLTVRAGDEFSDELCSRVRGSSPSGDISEVLLQGYAFVANGKIKKKTLVRV